VRRFGKAIVVMASFSPALAQAELRPLVRLTAGRSDEFSQSPDSSGDRFVFVSTESVTPLVAIATRRRLEARVLFDDGAPVGTPVMAPSGDRVAYVSFADDAKGDICVRDLVAGAGARCLTGSATQDASPVWAPDGKSVFFVARRGVEGVPELRVVAVDGSRPGPDDDAGRAVGIRGIALPALSPDGRYVAYVPIEAASEVVGAGLAPRGRAHVRVVDLARADGQGVEVAVPFPGVSAFPAFSRSGDYVYLTQYVNDTNGDGVLDGRDAGVILRVPFRRTPAGDPSVEVARAEQLTTAQVGCQYPTPAARELFVTCAKDGSLDVYATALDGRLAAELTDEQLADEGSAARSRFDKLLVRTRQLARARTPADERAILRSIVRIHMSLREFDAAGFYLERFAKAASSEEERREASLLRELVAHRASELRLGRGDLSATFVAEAQSRLARVTPFLSGFDATTESLALLVASEVNDALGEKDVALDLAKRVPWSKLDDADLVALVGKAQVELTRRMDDRAAQIDLGRRLASHRALSEGSQLGWGARLVRDVTRGLKRAQRDDALAKVAESVQPGGAAAFRVAVARALLPLAQETEEPTRAALFEIYKANGGFERRRALVEATMRAGADANAGLLLANFAKTWVGFVEAGTAERPYAEALYRGVMLERAYLARAKGQSTAARADYYAVLLVTDSLEAIEGFVDMRRAEGKGDGLQDLVERYGEERDERVQFARAYLEAQRLGDLRGPEHERAAALVIGRLDAAAERFGATCELQHLWSVVEAQRFLHGGDPERGASAKAHARLALDLCAEMPRFLASTRTALATVEAALGNFGEVVTAIAARSLLPHVDKGEALAACLLRARAHYHLGEDAPAKEAIDACAKLVSEDAAFEGYRALTEQRRGLYALGAGRYEDAAEAFATLARGASTGDAAQRLSVLLGLAASELGRGRGREALEAVEASRALVVEGARAPVGPYGRPTVRGSLAQSETWRRDVAILLDGLAGEAHALAGDYANAEPFLAARLASLEARFKVTGLDEDLEATAMGVARIADVAFALGRRDEALARYDRSLALLDDWGRRTGTPYGDAAVEVLRRYAAIAVGSSPGVRRDAAARLERAFTVLARRRDPKRARVRDELAAYLALLGEDARPVAQ
jgi:Tol biopolymer transport system component